MSDKNERERDARRKEAADTPQQSGPKGTPTEVHPVAPRYDDPDQPKRGSVDPYRGPDIPAEPEVEYELPLVADPAATPPLSKDPGVAAGAAKDGARKDRK